MQRGPTAAPHFAYWFIALFAVTQIPLYWIQYPDIMDFPNHLARLHVLMHLPDSETLQRYYELRKLQVGTNLAMELVVPALAGWMSLALALKVYASLTTLLLTTGAVALGRAVTGRFSYMLLGVLLFAHNAMFQLGLLNYLFGVGAAFWLLGAWVVAGEQAGLRRLMAFSAGCVLVYLCHLSALGVYCVGVSAYELCLARGRGGLKNLSLWRPMLWALTQFVPVTMIHMLLSSNSAGTYVPAPSQNAGFAVMIVYKALLALLAPAVSVSGYRLGQAIGLLIALALYVGFRQRALHLAASARWMAGLLALAIVLLPHAGFGSNLVDIRLLPALGLVAWCGLEATGRSSSLRPGAVLTAIASAVLLISLETTWEWGARDAEYGRVRSVLRQVPEGSRIATVLLEQGATPLSISPHVGAWSVIDSSTLLSSFYIWPFQPFWVAYREPYASLATLARTDDPAAAPPAYAELESVYDYVLVYGGDGGARLRYAPNVEAVHDSPSLRLLRTGRDRGAAPDSSGVSPIQ